MPKTNTQDVFARLDRELKEFQEMIRIDKYSLDEELVDQPGFLDDVGQRLATVTAYRDTAKADLEARTAQQDITIRAQAAEDARKITEKVVENEIIVSAEYQNALIVFQEWARRHARWMSLREAVSQRGYALKDLVALHVSGYWAEATGSSERREARAPIAERNKKAIAEKNRERESGKARRPQLDDDDD